MPIMSLIETYNILSILAKRLSTSGNVLLFVVLSYSLNVVAVSWDDLRDKGTLIIYYNEIMMIKLLYYFCYYFKNHIFVEFIKTNVETLNNLLSILVTKYKQTELQYHPRKLNLKLAKYCNQRWSWKVIFVIFLNINMRYKYF